MEPGDQILVANNIQPAIAEQAPTPADSVTFAKTTATADSSADIGNQIQESIQSSLRSDGQQIVVRLNPPELGRVAVKFTDQGGEITGLLQVDKLQTRDQLQQALPEIIQNLQDSGISVKRIEVVLTNQQQQYTSKDQSSTTGQDNFSGQQSSADQGQQSGNTYNQWLTNTDYGIEAGEPNMQFTDTSINMLV